MKPANLYRWADLQQDSPMPLLTRRRVIGEKMMISEITLKEGCDVPMHHHENEQISCVFSGWLRFQTQQPDGKTQQHDVRAGEVFVLPSNVPHSALAMEDTVVLDLFSPPSTTTGIDQPKTH